jgi:hypothetical protein
MSVVHSRPCIHRVGILLSTIILAGVRNVVGGFSSVSRIGVVFSERDELLEEQLKLEHHRFKLREAGGPSEWSDIGIRRATSLRSHLPAQAKDHQLA